MRYLLLLIFFVSGQQRLDLGKVDRILATLPGGAIAGSDKNIIKAIESVDRHYRRIADTLYGYKSLKHTIFQTWVIRIDDSVEIDPLTLGADLHTGNIIFNNPSINVKLDSIAKGLPEDERARLFDHLLADYDHFSPGDKILMAQPVRIRDIKFPNKKQAEVGIDIYGAHFLWIMDRTRNWDVISVERLGVY